MSMIDYNDYLEIKDSLLELQGYRKAYSRLLGEKRWLLERIKKNEEKDVVIYKDNVALEIISTLIDTIELYIELSKVGE